MPLSQVGEWGIIDWIVKNMPGNASGLIKGIGDDAAVLKGGEIVSTDMLIEGIHFHTKWQDYLRLGRKALSINLSDIAAMGGFPRCAFLCIAAPAKMDWRDMEAILTGFGQVAREHGVAVAGGDTCASPGPIVLSVTITGNTVRPTLRSGARPGDNIHITGTTGDAGLALRLCHVMRKSPIGGRNYEHLMNRLIDPKPRLEWGRYIAQIASSMIDTSDGLISDIRHICKESAVGARIFVDKLPLSEAYRFVKGKLREKAPNKFFQEALYGGEDYELLFTASTSMKEYIGRINGAKIITEIGDIVPAAEGITLVDATGKTEVKLEKVFSHF